MSAETPESGPQEAGDAAIRRAFESVKRVLADFEDRLGKHHRWAIASGNAARLSAMLQEGRRT